MALNPGECEYCFRNGRSPMCKREDCAHIRADRDRYMLMAAELHKAQQDGDIGFWEARAYFIRDESIRDQLRDARDEIDDLMRLDHLATEAIKAVKVGRNPHSEIAAWERFKKEMEDE